MRITVREENDSSPFGPIPIKIRYLGGGLEIVTIKKFGLNKTISKVIPVKYIDTTAPRTVGKVSKKKTKAEAAKPIEIKINFPIPSLKNSILFLRKPAAIFKKRSGVLKKSKFRFLVVIVALVVTSYFVFFHKSTVAPAENKGTGTNKVLLPRGTPSYPTLLPTGKTITQLGGWTRISPLNKNPVYAYVDSINNVPIDVSEQPLPANLQSNSNLAQLAKGFGDTERITLKNETIYLGIGAQGAQTLMFSKNNLLILVKADSPLTNDQWIQYIELLK